MNRNGETERTERDEVVQMITSGSVGTFHTSQGLIIPQCFGKTRKTWKLRKTGKLLKLWKNILWKSKSESCCRWSKLSENKPRQGARDAYISKIRSLSIVASLLEKRLEYFMKIL